MKTPIIFTLAILMTCASYAGASGAAAQLGLGEREQPGLNLPVPQPSPALPSLNLRLKKGSFTDLLDALAQLADAIGDLIKLLERMKQEGMELELYDPALFTLEGARADLQNALPARFGYVHRNLTGREKVTRALARNPAWLGGRETGLLIELLNELDKSGDLHTVVSRVQIWALPGYTGRNYFFDIYIEGGILLKLHYRNGPPAPPPAG
jgi:hypothetical protein